MSYDTCQRCRRPGREVRWNGRVRKLAPCFVCGYGATDTAHTPTLDERAEHKYNDHRGKGS